MVKHLVMFKLKTELPQERLNEIMQQFKQAIERLPESIACIRKIEVGININPAESWHVVLCSEFDSLEDVAIYASHPAHVAAASLLAEVKECRACVDYMC